MTKPIEVSCVRCNREVTLEHVGITTCKCGVRHHYVSVREEPDA